MGPYRIDTEIKRLLKTIEPIQIEMHIEHNKLSIGGNYSLLFTYFFSERLTSFASSHNDVMGMKGNSKMLNKHESKIDIVYNAEMERLDNFIYIQSIKQIWIKLKKSMLANYFTTS